MDDILEPDSFQRGVLKRCFTDVEVDGFTLVCRAMGIYGPVSIIKCVQCLSEISRRGYAVVPYGDKMKHHVCNILRRRGLLMRKRLPVYGTQRTINVFVFDMRRGYALAAALASIQRSPPPLAQDTTPVCEDAVKQAVEMTRDSTKEKIEASNHSKDGEEEW